MNHPWIIYLVAFLSVRIHRARTAPSRGASAVEWVIITAIIAGVALGLATLISQLVTEKQGDIENSFGGGGDGDT
jgi:Flp pilus assembly pilin Flp